MIEQQEPIPELPAAPARRPSGRTTFCVGLILMAIIWIVVMLFRWELRAQWWAYQVAHCEQRDDRDFYLTRLASIRDKALNAAAGLAADPRPDVRRAAVSILRYCEKRTAADILVHLLTDDDNDVAIDASTALAQRRDAASYIPQLEPRLRDNPGRNSWGSAVALGRIGGSQAERILKHALAGPLPPDLKAQVIDSLGMLGCEDAGPLIIDALNDDRTIQDLPQSQQSAQRAVAALRPDLQARGADPNSALQAVSTAPTVAAVAARWVRLLSGLDAESVATQPASRREPAIRDLKERWAKPRGASRPG